MTAALSNNAQGTPFATGVDAFVYPQFIGYALRAPTTQDIYNPGTRWQDNSVNPAVIYQTTGAGLWYQDTSAGGSFTSLTVTPGPTNITGTTNINTSGAGVTSIGTGGTGATNIGNATGNTAVTGSLTASTGLVATTGGVTATAGNFTFTAAGSKEIHSSVGTTTAAGANSIGTVTLAAGTATVATTSVTASSIIRLTRMDIGATGAAALGILTVGTIVAGTSFVISAVQAADATANQASDVSVIAWEIIN